MYSVYSMARQLDGVCTWDFSQSFPVLNIRQIAGSGICLSLASHWIKYHAYDDSLVNHLGGVWDQRRFIPFNMGKYQRIAAQQQAWVQSANWRASHRAWLLLNRLRVLSSATGRSNRDSLRQRLKQINGAYALIEMCSSRDQSQGAHAVAAWVGAQSFGGQKQGACFFDPNFGEFWFEDKEDFYFFFHLVSNMHYRAEHKFDLWKIDRIWKV
ncbi:YopT-type cysteine protease domain-containing protein [Microbulbifer sp. TRSA007]|uniref:YopT-type cysteine protease domain-containing protein n=1 Tax=unclassified Microbulbifer TaxID=2619833 RepID=UPI0040396FB8